MTLIAVEEGTALSGLQRILESDIEDENPEVSEEGSEQEKE